MNLRPLLKDGQASILPGEGRSTGNSPVLPLQSKGDGLGFIRDTLPFRGATGMASNSLADSTSRETWRREARRASMRWNLAWWLDRAAPLVVGAAFLGAGMLLYLRSENADVGIASSWPWIAGGFVVVMAIAWSLARRFFCTQENSLVRLESKMKLNNALTAAEQGVRPWPAPVQKVDDGIRWNWTWILSPFLIAAGLLAAGYLIPMQPAPELVDNDTKGPRGWEQIENAIRELEQNEAIEPRSIEELKEKLSKLKNQPRNEWFSHSSMEATDTLKQSLRDAAFKMGDNLEQAGESLSTLEQFGDQMSPQAKEKLMEEFREAVDGLKSGDLKPNKELMDQLSNIDPSAFQNQLTPGQMQKLKDNLKKNQQACENASGQNGEGEGQGDGPLSQEEQDLMSLLGRRGQPEKQERPGTEENRQRSSAR